MSLFQIAVLLVFPAAVFFAAAMDLVSYTIPNRVSIALVAGFVLLAPFAGMTLQQFVGHLGAGALVLAVTFAMFFFNVMGGGDAKLVSAVALWVGLEHLLEYLLLASIFGGVLAIGLLMFRSVPLPMFLARENWVLELHKPRGAIPYGIALSAAALCVYPQTIWCSGVIG